MVAVEVCAKTGQVGNAIKTTIAITNLPNERRLTPSFLTILRSFRTANYKSENQYGRRLGLRSGSSWSVFRLYKKQVVLTAVAVNEPPIELCEMVVITFSGIQSEDIFKIPCQTPKYRITKNV